ncbi:MAG: hypothetical protein COW65_17775 [Cytophagales bacterium CG18_big_fil_WC_8_21_14_2_50_42_9]|nr:MAG: hypothetical protein COW65_17775 [Cytophagales bacterium CG18_big_fil_WC_8_21_14_2_50_42_9]
MEFLERAEYYFLPEKYHRKHDICEFLIGQIESFITEDTYKGLKVYVYEVNANDVETHDEHVFDFLLRTNRTKEHDEIITRQIIYGLIIDICYFVQESLLASMKKRLTVTFALIRKPFVFDLIILLRLYLTEDFIQQFNTIEKFDTTKLEKDDLIELINFSAKILITTAIQPNDVYNFIFNLSESDSLINITNRALHPSTTRNKQNLTGLQNINFIFSTEKEIEKQWDYLYNRLPLLLTYMLEVIEFMVNDTLKIDDDFYFKRLKYRAEFLSNKMNNK